MRSKSARVTAPIALFTALLVIALNTWFAVAAVRALLESENWLAHTWEVIGQNERLMTSVTNAESSARGYVVTGREGSLDSFHDAEQTLPRDVNRFQALTTDNPLQQQNIQELNSLIDRRMAILRESIAARRIGFEAAQTLAMTGSGANEMEQIRRVIGKMEGEEQHLLVNRGEEARRDGIRAFFTISLAGALDLMMIGLAAYYFIQERRQRSDLEATAHRLMIARTEA